ncbi:hypothetical protein ACFW7J_38950 [Streptomyces sp. NPDC059525]|uniref:hypothetical protein n=1 Tax=Streptomyces sp. NPDC059525 TaxID=3346857 RepID=UPI003685B86B
MKAGLVDNMAWRQGSTSDFTGRLVTATLRALTTPPGMPVPDDPHHHPARSQGPRDGAGDGL